jgi:prepilin-type N-terminal cleavage/methylation domain-containing protein
MMKKGFTLAEILVVLAIIFILTSISSPFYRMAQRQYTIENAAQKLAQDIRRVEEMAMAAREQPRAPVNFQRGYGIRLQTNSSSYILFADLNNNRNYDPGEEIEISSLGENVRITNLSPGSPLTIIFLPPDPQAIITPSTSLAKITLSLLGSSTFQRSIVVNALGLIYVE